MGKKIREKESFSGRLLLPLVIPILVVVTASGFWIEALKQKMEIVAIRVDYMEDIIDEQIKVLQSRTKDLQNTFNEINNKQKEIEMEITNLSVQIRSNMDTLFEAIKKAKDEESI